MDTMKQCAEFIQIRRLHVLLLCDCVCFILCNSISLCGFVWPPQLMYTRDGFFQGYTLLKARFKQQKKESHHPCNDRHSGPCRLEVFTRQQALLGCGRRQVEFCIRVSVVRMRRADHRVQIHCHSAAEERDPSSPCSPWLYPGRAQARTRAPHTLSSGVLATYTQRRPLLPVSGWSCSEETGVCQRAATQLQTTRQTRGLQSVPMPSKADVSLQSGLSRKLERSGGLGGTRPIHKHSVVPDQHLAFVVDAALVTKS